MSRDHILFLIRSIDQIDFHAFSLVCQMYGRLCYIVVCQCHGLMRKISEFGVQIPVLMGDCQCRFVEAPPALCRISIIRSTMIAMDSALEIRKSRRIFYDTAEMQCFQTPVLLHPDNHGNIVGPDIDYRTFCLGCTCQQCQHGNCQDFLHRCH